MWLGVLLVLLAQLTGGSQPLHQTALGRMDIVAASSDGALVVGEPVHTGEVWVYNTRTGQEVKAGLGYNLGQVIFAPTAEVVALVYDDHVVVVQGTQVVHLPVTSEAVALSLKGHSLACAVGRTVQIWDWELAKLKRTISLPEYDGDDLFQEIKIVRFVPDGVRVLVEYGRTIKVQSWR